AVARRQRLVHAPVARLGGAALATLARVRDLVGVDDPAAAVAGADWAGRPQPFDPRRHLLVGDLDERRPPAGPLLDGRSYVGLGPEGGVVLQERELDRVGWAVAVLADDQLGDPLQPLTLIVVDRLIPVPVVVLAVDKGHEVGVLLEVAGLAKVREDRPLVAPGPLLGRPR